MILKGALFFLLFPLSLIAQDIQPILTRDWSTKSSIRSHEVLSAGTVIDVNGDYVAGSLNEELKEGVNYFLIYDNNGRKELIYTNELILPKRFVPEQTFTFDIAATQISLLNNICKLTKQKETDILVYSAGEIIVTNDRVTEINNRSFIFSGGRDEEHLDFSIEILKKVGLELEPNTNLANYTKEQYGQEASSNRCYAQLILLRDQEKSVYLSKISNLYAGLADKYPDPKMPGFVDVEELSSKGFDNLSEFFARVQDDGSSLAVVTKAYFGDLTELNSIIADADKVLKEESPVSNGKERSELVREIFDQAVKDYGETPLAVLSILSNKDIVPENGIVLVLGSGVDFYEWLVPILKRSDVKVVVSEASRQVMESVLYFDNLRYGDISQIPNIVIPKFAERMWKELNKSNPELIENGIIKSQEALAEAIKKQITFRDAYNSTGSNVKDVEADLIISRLPYKYDVYGTLKKDGFAWIVTERALDVDKPDLELFNDPTTFKTAGYDVVKLPDNRVNTLLGSSENAVSMPGRFLAFDLKGEERSFLLFPVYDPSKYEEQKKSQYSDLYLVRNYKIKNVKGTYLTAGDIFSEGEGRIKLPELPYGGKVLYVLYESSDGKVKMAYSSEVPDLDVDLKAPDAEILVTHRSLYNKIISRENAINGVVGAGEIILMPNGEIPLITNRSNTFRGKQHNLDFAAKFFKDHGLAILDNTAKTDYDLGRPAKDHSTSLEQAKALVRIVQNPTAFSYYKDLIDTQRELASIMKSSFRPGGALDEEKILGRVFPSTILGFISEIESMLSSGEGIAVSFEAWLENSGGTFPYTERLDVIKQYIRDNKGTKNSPIILPIIISNSSDPNREEKEYYPNSTLIKSIKKYSDNKLSSEETFYMSGRKSSKTVYKDGIKHGMYEAYYDKDAPGSTNKASMLSEHGFYNNGKISGVYYCYHDNGNKSIVYLHDLKTGMLKTATKYDLAGFRATEYFIYNETGDLVEASLYHASGQIKKKVKLVEGKINYIEITEYEDQSDGQIIKSVRHYNGTDVKAALSYEPAEDVGEEIYDESKIEELNNIILSLSKPSTDELRKIEKYVTYLIQNKSDIKQIDVVMKWLVSSYDNLQITDRTTIKILSNDFLDLRSKTTPDFYTFNKGIDHKEISSSLRSYLGFKPLVPGKKNYQADVEFLMPLAIQQFTTNMNKKFEQGIGISELMTEIEFKTFIQVWSYMVYDLYKASDSFTKMDVKLTARFLAVKDLAEILNVDPACYSAPYITLYTEAKYMMDETIIKSKEKGFVDDNLMETYKKDVELKYRSVRLESSTKVY